MDREEATDHTGAMDHENSTSGESARFTPGAQNSARGVAPDPEVVELIAEHRAAIAPILDEQIATAAVDLLFAPDAECPMGNWTSDVMREAAEAEIAFQNPGGVRASIAAGPIRYADVYRAMPFDNTIFVAEMSGTEIRDYLEAAGVRGSFLHVSGLHYRIDYTRPPGNRVSSLHFEDGSHLEPARIHRVAVNSFMAQGGDDLPVLLGRPGARDTGVFVREALAAACRSATASNQTISAVIEGRVVQAP
jgi:2',3'-cyclic-nucleotide 2'-phosphodiesterase (5'-nucleotidase family)